MAEHSKKLYISKGGNLEAIPLYTDLTEVGTPAMRLQDGNDTVFAKMGTGSAGASSLKCLHNGIKYSALQGADVDSFALHMRFEDPENPLKTDVDTGIIISGENVSLNPNSKFGNYSFEGDFGFGWETAPVSPAWNTTPPWTFECWFYVKGIPNAYLSFLIASEGISGGCALLDYNRINGRWEGRIGGSGSNIKLDGIPISYNKWNHFFVQRNVKKVINPSGSYGSYPIYQMGIDGTIYRNWISDASCMRYGISFHSNGFVLFDNVIVTTKERYPTSGSTYDVPTSPFA